MKNAHIFSSLAAIILAAYIGVAIAADQSHASLSGTIVDIANKKVLGKANVIVVGTNYGTVSDEQGRFTIEQLPAGRYTIKVRLLGYEPMVQVVDLTAGQNSSLQFQLRESYFKVDQVVVTATRSEKLLENVPIVTEVVSNAEIQDRGAENLAQALQDRPGITIMEESSGGKTLRMNGIDGKYVLVLVDGVPLAGKFNNRTELNILDADQVEHIEIVKGPSSALYGSEAMGGVVNVITKGFSDDLAINATTRAGTFDLYSGNLNVSGTSKGIGYQASIDHSQGGIDKSESSIDVTDMRTSGGSGKLRFNNSVLGQLQAGGDYKEDILDSESRNRQGLLLENQSKIKRYNTHLTWGKMYADKLSLKAVGYYSDYFRTYTSAGSIDSTINNIIGVKSDILYAPHKNLQLAVGFDYSRDQYEADRVENDKVLRNQSGVFAQAELKPFDRFTFVLGGRYDKITNINGFVSPRLSGMLELTSDLKLRAAVGRGFRAASFTDMYADFIIPIPFSPIRVVGNKDLVPERSTGFDFGLEYFWNSRILMNATVYQNKFKDMILDYSVEPRVLSYRNFEHATFTGVEWQSRFYLLNNLTTTLTYSYTNVDQSKENVEVTRISPHSATLRFQYSLLKNRLKLSFRDQFFSDREVKVFDPTSGRYLESFQTKQAFNLMDASLLVKINHLFSLRLGGTNLSDYTDNYYGPWIGRRLFSTLEVTY